MKTVVIFQSKYGSTKKYAQWIAEELSCDIFEKKNVKAGSLDEYDTIIYGGGLYAGGVSGIDLLVKNFDRISNKNLILFTCGLADPSETHNTDSIKAGLKKVLSPQMQEKIKVYHLRGAVDYSKLNVVHKSMLAMVHKMVQKKDPSSMSDEDKEMLATYGQAVDFTDKESIAPILEYVSKLH